MHSAKEYANLDAVRLRSICHARRLFRLRQLCEPTGLAYRQFRRDSDAHLEMREILPAWFKTTAASGAGINGMGRFRPYGIFRLLRRNW